MHADPETIRLAFLAAVAAAMLAAGTWIGHWIGHRRAEARYADGWDGGLTAERGRWEDLTGSTYEEMSEQLADEEAAEAEGAAQREAWQATGPLAAWAPRRDPEDVGAEEWAGLEAEQRGQPFAAAPAFADAALPTAEALLTEARRQGYTGRRVRLEPYDPQADPYAALYRPGFRRPDERPPVEHVYPAASPPARLPVLAAFRHGQDLGRQAAAARSEDWPALEEIEREDARTEVVIAVVTEVGQDPPRWMAVAAAECAAQDADAARFIAQLQADMTVHRAQVRALTAGGSN